jgi:hypothetical protein
MQRPRKELDLIPPQVHNLVRWVRGVQADGDVHGPRDHVSPTRASPVDASELSGLPNNPVGSYPIGALRGMAAAFFVSLAFLNRRNT